jgi:hypothetical protein
MMTFKACRPSCVCGSVRVQEPTGFKLLCVFFGFCVWPKCTQSVAQTKRADHFVGLCPHTQAETFGSVPDAPVSIVPAGLNLDTVHSMGLETMPANSRSAIGCVKPVYFIFIFLVGVRPPSRVECMIIRISSLSGVSIRVEPFFFARLMPSPAG